MCYDDEARPPLPAAETGPIHSEDIVLTASDGNRFAAFFAAPTGSSEANIIIYPDNRGLHQFYKELARRFAEVGIVALALDYFGRTAGLTSREEPFEAMPHMQQMKLETFSLDVQAGLNYLREKTSANRPTFVVGFCAGGSFTLRTGTNPAFGFAGLIPFYAGLSRSMGSQPTVLEMADQIAYPVLGFFGGADPVVPESDVKQLDLKLDTAKVEHNLIIYPGATHSFFDKRAAEFADASADAWTQLLAFIASHQHVHTH